MPNGFAGGRLLFPTLTVINGHGVHRYVEHPSFHNFFAGNEGFLTDTHVIILSKKASRTPLLRTREAFYSNADSKPQAVFLYAKRLASPEISGRLPLSECGYVTNLESKQIVQAFRHRRMGVDEVAQDLVFQVVVHSEFNEVDHFMGFGAEELNAEDLIVRTDDGFEDPFRFAQDFGLGNGRSRQIHDPVFDILSLGFAFAEADPRERRIDEDRVRESTAVLRRPVAFAAHVRHDDAAVVEGNVSKLQIAADVAGSPDVGNVGPEVFVRYDSASVREAIPAFSASRPSVLGRRPVAIKMASPSKTVSVSPTV